MIKNKVYCIDIDGTICSIQKDYSNARPYKKVIEKINRLYDKGNKIIFYTARGTVTKKDWKALTKKQLKEWGVKYHQLLFGKPYYDVFIDDKNGVL